MARPDLVPLPTRFPPRWRTPWLETQWVSAEARTGWERRLQAITAALHRAEQASVGLFRQAAILQMSAEEARILTQTAPAEGRVAIWLATAVRDPAPIGYRAEGGQPPAADTTPWGSVQVTVGVAEPSAAADLVAAYQASDHDRLGALLGYPACCRAWFVAYWGTYPRWVDPTWLQALGSADRRAADEDAFHVTLDGSAPRGASTLWRQLGVRLVRHLPCSFTCQASVAIGAQFLELLERLDRDAAQDVRDLLEVPVRWSAWHGVGELATPILRVTFPSEVTAEHLIVDVPGRRWPEHGAIGTRFPYLPPSGLLPLVRRPARTVSAGSAGSPAAANRPPWAWNGFASAEAERAAHEAILAAAVGVVSGQIVCDLGCGTGALLRLALTAGAVRAIGIEREAVPPEVRAEGVEWRQGDLFDPEMWPEDATAVFIMPGRLLETPDRADPLLAWLRRREYLIAYWYADWDATLARPSPAAPETAWWTRWWPTHDLVGSADRVRILRRRSP